MTLGQRIQQFRKEKRLSQEALGETMGVSRQAISKWEGDTAVPELDKLIALSKLFGVSVGQLLGTEEVHPDLNPEPVSKKDGTRRWLAGLTALCVLLTGAVGLLWYRYNQLRQTLTMTELATVEYTAIREWELPMFDSSELTTNDLELNFRRSQGSQDLILSFDLAPSNTMAGWELLPLYVVLDCVDPFSEEWPRKSWTEEYSVELRRHWDGSYTGELTLENYGGDPIRVDACFRQKSTGLTAEIEALFRIDLAYSKNGQSLVQEMHILNDARVARVPTFLAQSATPSKYSR